MPEAHQLEAPPPWTGAGSTTETTSLMLTCVSAVDTVDIIRKLEAVDGVLRIGEATA